MAEGVAFNPFGFVWVSSADGTVFDALRRQTAVVQSLVVRIPSPTMATGGNPTGIVLFNGIRTVFVVTARAGGGGRGPSGRRGSCSPPSRASSPPGRRPSISTHAHSQDQIGSSTGAKLPRGLALSGEWFDAVAVRGTDFFSTRAWDVFDSNFMPVIARTGRISRIRAFPGLCAVSASGPINGDIYVTYARHGFAGEHVPDERPLCRLRLLERVRSPNGKFARRDRGRCWRAQCAMGSRPSHPVAFGTFHNALLVGNFGDGRIKCVRLRRRARCIGHFAA
jgi:hypothetical protein